MAVTRDEYPKDNISDVTVLVRDSTYLHVTDYQPQADTDSVGIHIGKAVLVGSLKAVGDLIDTIALELGHIYSERSQREVA